MATELFQKITNDFDLLTDWEDRYGYIIELGRELTPLETAQKTDQTKVEGCASQVWLTHEIIGEGPSRIVRFNGESDALIVKGLIAIILALFNERKISDARNVDALKELNKLGLHEHLSSQRSNGLRAMIDRIKLVITSS